MTARQLPAHALKALTVRVSLALTFDVPDWPTQITEREYDDCVHVRDALLLCANRAESLPDDKETPEEFLPKVIDAARKLCDQVESDEVVRRLKAFQKELQKQYKGQAVVSVQHVLDSVTEAVTQWVHSAHGSAAAPALVIHTVQVDADASDGMLRKFCVSAQHSVADDDTSLASEVTVRFKQKAFCWEALCQLPYVLTHELVCHVFQGMAGDTRRTTASPCCAWSEGWMDTLAYGIYSRLCHRSVKQPSWWISEAERVHRNGRAFHDLRYEAGAAGLKAVHIKGRRQARNRFDKFLSALSLALGSDDAGWEAAARVSVRLNAENLGRRRWARLLNDLRILLEQPLSTKYSRFIRNSLEFIENKLSTAQYLENIKVLADS